MRGAKSPPTSLKSVAHMLQWENLAQQLWWLQCYLVWKDQTPSQSPSLWTSRHFASHWKKGKDWQQQTNSGPRTRLMFLCCNYSPSFEEISILTRESNDFKLKIMESLLIARDKPILNKADSSLPLQLF